MALNLEQLRDLCIVRERFPLKSLKTRCPLRVKFDLPTRNVHDYEKRARNEPIYGVISSQRQLVRRRANSIRNVTHHSRSLDRNHSERM